MPKEIYRSTSLWKSVFSPGVGLCIPNLAAVTADKWAQHVLVCPKEGRYVQSCRSPKLLQRLLESGCDDKLRQCLFLTPPPSKESVKETRRATSSATSSATGTQTQRQASTSVVSCQTRVSVGVAATQTVQRQSTELACQTQCPIVVATSTQTTGTVTAVATQTVPRPSTQSACQTPYRIVVGTATQTTDTVTATATQTAPRPSTQSACQTPYRIVVGTATQTTDTVTATATQTVPRPSTQSACQTPYQIVVGTATQTTDTVTAAAARQTEIQLPTDGCETHNRYWHDSGDDQVEGTTVSPAGDTCWSPTPDDTASNHAPGCLEVGFSPNPGTSHTAELSTNMVSRGETWVPWTNEEMAHMAKAWTVVPQDTASHHASGCLDVGFNPTPVTSHTAELYTHMIYREETWVPWTNEEMAQMAKEYAASADATMIAPPSMPVHAASSAPHVSVTMPETDIPPAVAIPAVADALVPWTPLTTTLQSANSYRIPPMTDLPGDVVIVHPDYLDMHTQILGKGAFGSIFRVREVGSPESFPLVCKRIMLGIAGVSRSFSTEVTVLHRLQHLSMVPRLYGVVEKTPRLPDHHILMEFLPAARELCHLVQTAAKLSNYLWLDVLVQVAQAMEAIHAAGVLHNDIKFDNVMVTLIAPAAVKVHMIDFGLSSIGPWSMGYDRYMERSQHVAPEVYDGIVTSTESDIYSFGLLVEQVNYVIHNDKLHALQAACMEEDPRGRPLIDEIINYLKEVQRYIV